MSEAEDYIDSVFGDDPIEWDINPSEEDKEHDQKSGAAQGDGQSCVVWHEVNPNPGENMDDALLPLLDKTVLVVYLSNYDDKPIMAFGGRSDDGEGWLWGIEPSNCCGQDFEAEIVCDDEYRVTHWTEIPWPALAAVAHNEEK